MVRECWGEPSRRTNERSHYGSRIRQAGAFGDAGPNVDLESPIADETRYNEHVERMLAGWVERRPASR